MKKQLTITVMLLSLLVGFVVADEDKYAVKAPGGLAFSEFRGHEDWQAIGVSRSEKAIAVIRGNPAMIAAYRNGIPES